MSNYYLTNYDSWKLASPYDDEELCHGCDRLEGKCRCQQIDWEIDRLREEAIGHEMRNEKLSEEEGQ